MATEKKLFQLDVSRGMVQNTASWINDGWYYLNNLRPRDGWLEQVPRVRNLVTLPLTGFGVMLGLEQYRMGYDDGYFVIGQRPRFVKDSDASVSTIPVVSRFEFPSRNTTITAECILYGLNLIDFAEVDDYWAVVVTSATTITVAKNGGTPSDPMTIANGMSISANGLKLGFMTTTGFNIGDTWVWKRFDVMSNIASDVSMYATYTTMYKADAYFSFYGTIFRLRNGIVAPVGYRQLGGRYVTVFQNHLVVGGANTQGDQYAMTGDRPFTVAWSHLNDPDQFFSTDLNEADQYVIPRNLYDSGAAMGITGLETLGQMCYVYTSDSIYEMAYVGYPVVMQVLPKNEGVGCAYPSSLVAGQKGHYFISRTSISLFDGTSVQSIGDEIKSQLFSELPIVGSTYSSLVFGHYNAYEHEVMWTYHTDAHANRAVVYNEITNKWYFRDMLTRGSSTFLAGATAKQGNPKVSVFGIPDGTIGERLLVEELTLGTGACAKDMPLTTYGYSRPEAISKYLNLDRPFEVKDFDNFKYSMFQLPANLGPTLSYSIQDTAHPQLITRFTTVKALTPAHKTHISIPRIAAEAVSFKIQDTATEPASVSVGLTINQIAIEYRVSEVDRER